VRVREARDDVESARRHRKSHGEAVAVKNLSLFLNEYKAEISTYEVNPEITMSKILMCFIRDESGATAIEYGLIAAGIAVAIISVVKGLGTNLKTTFGSIQTAVAPAA
jgi:pilus assembly protein Flp/PilA